MLELRWLASAGMAGGIVMARRSLLSAWYWASNNTQMPWAGDYAISLAAFQKLLDNIKILSYYEMANMILFA